MSPQRHPRFFGYASDAAERAYKDLPEDVLSAFGFDFWVIQQGEFPTSAKVLKGFGGADILELRDSDEAGTYRAVYTVRFTDWVYVLHSFQKKSKRGISTDKKDIDLIKKRLGEAESRHAEWLREQRGGTP